MAKEPNAKYTAGGKPYDLRERTFLFSTDIIDLCSKVPNGVVPAVIVTQLIKSATSIGANVQEADGALTKADKRNKFVIARKEANETKYWLRLLERRFVPSENIAPHIQECTEIINILSTIISRL